jgi:N-acetylglucosamine-6-phosphate deacetylase
VSAVEGFALLTGEAVRLHVSDGLISEVEPLPEGKAGHLPYIAPGLVDLQINGAAGVDFNFPPVTAERFRHAVSALWAHGVTSFCPTVITNGAEQIEGLLEQLKQAASADPLIRSSVAGFHLEGPFLSPEDGPRGAHPREHIRRPDIRLLERWQKAAGGLIRIVTLAPEWEESPAFIRRCVERGIIAAIGHTAANSAQIREAVSAGASLSTHLGNGAHPVLPRHPNYIWDQLAADELWTAMIADGFHLPASLLKVFCRVKAGKAVLVSDAVSLAGMPPGKYKTHIGGDVVLTEEGKLHMAETPELLAGSAQLLLHGVGHLARLGIATLAEAWRMASLLPASLLKLPAASGLSAGSPADFVVLRRDGERLQVCRTYKAGRLVYEKS